MNKAFCTWLILILCILPSLSVPRAVVNAGILDFTSSLYRGIVDEVVENIGKAISTLFPDDADDKDSQPAQVIQYVDPDSPVFMFSEPGPSISEIEPITPATPVTPMTPVTPLTYVMPTLFAPTATPIFVSKAEFDLTLASMTDFLLKQREGSTDAFNRSFRATLRQAERDTATVTDAITSISSTLTTLGGTVEALAVTSLFSTSTTRGVFSATSPIDYDDSSGVFSVSSGYNIPLTASTTEWASKVSSQWTTSGSDIYFNGGNVGIGTTTPQEELSVTGDMFVSGSINGATLSSNALSVTNSGVSTWTGSFGNWTAGGEIRSTTLSLSGGIIGFGTTGSADSSDVKINRTSVGNATLTATNFGFTGNVGIGTTSPSYKLDVVGSSENVARFMNTGSNSASILMQSSDRTSRISTGNYGTGIQVEALEILRTGPNTLLEMKNGNGTTIYGTISSLSGNKLQLSAENDLILQPTTGNVGVGTTTPTAKLDVWGNFNVGTSSTPDLLIDTSTGLTVFNAKKASGSTVGFQINTPNGTSATPFSIDGFGVSMGQIRSTSGSNIQVFDTSNKTVGLLADTKINWSNSTTGNYYSTNPDVGLARDSAGVLKVTNATTGGGSLMADYFTATSTTATSTFSGGLSVGSDYFRVDQSGNIYANRTGKRMFFDDGNSSRIYTGGSNNISIFGSASEDFGLNITNENVTIGPIGTAPFKVSSSGLLGVNSEPTSGYMQRIESNGSGVHLLLSRQVGNFLEARSSNLSTLYSAITSTGGAYFSGNVGIGTTTPSQALDVNGYLNVGAGGYTTASLRMGGYNTGWSSASDYRIDGVVNGVQMMSFDNRGGGNAAVAIYNGSGALSANKIWLGNSDTGLRRLSAGVIGVTNSYNTDGGSISADFFTATSTTATSTFAGYVGIGTTNPTNALSVNGSIEQGASGNLFQGYGRRVSWGSTGLAYNVNAAIGANNGDQLVVDGLGGVILNGENVGKIGIGTTTPGYKLTVAGTAGFAGLTSAVSSGDALCLSASNEMIVNTGAQTCTVSSRRFKNDIESLDDGNGLSMVRAMRPVSFKLNDGGEERLGFIAEEIVELDPRLVGYERDGLTPRTVRYEEITSVLTKAIQELDLKVEALSATSTSSSSGVSGLLASIGAVVEGGVAKFTSIFAKKISTDELCVDGVCVTRNEFKAMVNMAKDSKYYDPEDGDDSSSNNDEINEDSQTNEANAATTTTTTTTTSNQIDLTEPTDTVDPVDQTDSTGSDSPTPDEVPDEVPDEGSVSPDDPEAESSENENTGNESESETTESESTSSDENTSDII